MITLESITKKFGIRTLFEDVSISFNENSRYGLTGPNGSGKSTLLKIIMKLEEPASGGVFKPKKIGFLKQNIEDFKDFTVINAVIYGNKHLYQAMSKRDRLYEMEMTNEIGFQLAEIEEIIAEENGYFAEAEAQELLTGMGINQKYHKKILKEIPLDMQFRVLLCQALFGKPDALLLDEPTNHLDLESITWLEEFLKKYTGTLIVISHDRCFLNTISTDIADIDYNTIIMYPGNYDDMILTKTKLRDKAEKEAKNKEKKIAQLKEFIQKFKAGTRASQVKSREKEIQRIQPQELKKSNIQRPYIRFIPSDKSPGKLIFKIENICKCYKQNQVIENFSYDVMRSDKIAVTGNNGLGKTTFLKMLAQVLTPDMGEFQIGHNVQIGYFPQNHQDIIDKRSDLTIFEWLKLQKNEILEQEIRSVLGKLLFSGDDAFKKLSTLSGGETARLILAKLMMTNPNTLILDEPNNHLDLEAVSALAWGLNEFKGTVLFSSHDRNLISKVATKILVFEEDNKISHFIGNYDEYLSSKKLYV